MPRLDQRQLGMAPPQSATAATSEAAAEVRRRPTLGVRSARKMLPSGWSFWILAGLFVVLFFASAAASPLYPVYATE